MQNIKLPTRELIINKGSIYNLKLSAINYEAKIEIANNIYRVDNNGTITINPIVIHFKDWTREGVQYAEQTGNPVIAMPNNERLKKLKESPFSIEKATIGLNTTYTEKGITKISSDDILKSMSLSGDVLFDILNIKQDA